MKQRTDDHTLNTTADILNLLNTSAASTQAAGGPAILKIASENRES